MAVTEKMLTTIILLLLSRSVSTQNTTTTTTPPIIDPEILMIDPEILKLLSLYITPYGPGVSEACQNASQKYIDALNDVSNVK